MKSEVREYLAKIGKEAERFEGHELQKERALENLNRVKINHRTAFLIVESSLWRL
jgi:hypothetical protein